MGYTKHALKGISWIGAYRLIYRLISLARIPIILRILSPIDYGAFGVGLLLLGLSEVITETGINIVLIQEKEEVDNYIDTAWVISIIRGLCISLFMFLTASFFSSFFHSPQAYRLLLLMSVIPFLRGFINPSVAKFTKNLQYNKEFIYRSTPILFDSLISVIAVVILRNPLGLIIGMTFSVLYEVILSFILASPHPRLAFNNGIFKKIVKRGKWITATVVFNYLYQNADNIIVGRILGPFYLGIYDRAYNISMLPITEIAEVIMQVTLPIYVRISDDVERLKRAFIRTVLLILACVLPISIVFYFFAHPLISLLMGPKWISSIPVLQVLAFFGVTRALMVAANSLFISRNKQEYSSILIFTSFIGMALTIVPFIHRWQIIGAGLAAITGSLLSLPVLIYFLMKIFKNKDNNSSDN